MKKFLSNGGEFDEVTNRLLNFLLVNHEVYDLAKLLEIEPELKEELLTGKLSVAMNKYLGTLLENGYVWNLESNVGDLKRLLKILPELKERLLTGEWSGAMNKCLRTLLENGNIWDLKNCLRFCQS